MADVLAPRFTIGARREAGHQAPLGEAATRCSGPLLFQELRGPSEAVGGSSQAGRGLGTDSGEGSLGKGRKPSAYRPENPEDN